MNRDEWCRLECGHCKFHNVNADSEEPKCKRIDHKHIKFYKPYFKAYDCGQFNQYVCKDFAPNPLYGWLFEHWEGFDDYFSDGEHHNHIPLVVDNDFNVIYLVHWDDWVNNTFLSDSGEVKWYEKHTIKRGRVERTRKNNDLY